MRVAPMALLMAAHHFYDVAQMDTAAAENAKVTHKHPLAFLPAAMLTHLIYRIISMDVNEIVASMSSIVDDTIDSLANVYPGEYENDKQILASLTRKAVSLVGNGASDAENIRELGEGWTGEEAWAIALYCALRHIGSVEDAIIAAVNHDGDSDSTGAVCGNIMGAIYGYEELKRRNIFCPDGHALEDTLELSNIILAIADDLYSGCIISEYSDIDTPEKAQWYARYCRMLPFGIAVKNGYNRKFTPEQISSLKEGEIFVFGSNLAGAHGGGAARYAYQHFGAEWGCGVGMTGSTYAIPTMQGGVETIMPYVDEFIRFAIVNSEFTFFVTRIGCGIAGFRNEDIAPLFKDAISVPNIILPREFVACIEKLA